MASGRTTKRVQCPGCGDLLRPSHDLLMGRGSLGCACGFGIDSPAPPPLDVVPPPRRRPAMVLFGLGWGMFGVPTVVAAAGWLFLWELGEAAAPLAGVACAGAAVLAWGGRLLWRRRRWFHSAEIFEDAAMRRSVLRQARELHDRADRNADRQVELFLADRGVAAPEFRRAVIDGLRAGAVASP